MKFLFVTDLHLRLRNPINRIDNFKQTCIEKLKEVFELAKDCDYIICGGDLFDSFDPTYSFLYEIIKLFKTNKVPFLTTLGNHDMEGGNLLTYRRSGVGILKQAEVLDILRDDRLTTLDNIRLKAIHYRVNPRIEDYIADNDTIIVSHDMVSVNPLVYDHFLCKDIKTDSPLVLCSHYHGFFNQIIKGTRFINPGSLLRKEANQDSLERMPKVFEIEIGISKRIGIKLIELKCAKKGSEVFDWKRIELLKDKQLDFDQFLSSLMETECSEYDIEEIIKDYGRKNNIDKEIIEESLNRVRTAKCLI